MVWTSETGMRLMASELRIWPPIWKAVRGRVVMMSSREGLRIPWRSTGIELRRGGWMRAAQDSNRHHEHTNMNWIRVKVTGLGKAVRMAFDEVLDMIEVVYQMAQRNFCQRVSTEMVLYSSCKLNVQ